MDIKDRIAHVLKTKNITATQLAEELDIQRSGISHILSGRNNPSMDFLIKLKESFPEFSLDWLLLGEGPATLSPVAAGKQRQPDLFAQTEVQGDTKIGASAKAAHQQTEVAVGPSATLSDTKSAMKVENIPSTTAEQKTPTPKENASTSEVGRHLTAKADKSIVKIVFVYEDQTFSVYTPSAT